MRYIEVNCLLFLLLFVEHQVVYQVQVQGAFYDSFMGKIYVWMDWELNLAKPLCDQSVPENATEISPDMIFITKYKTDEYVHEFDEDNMWLDINEQTLNSTSSTNASTSNEFNAKIRAKRTVRLNPVTYEHHFKVDDVSLKELEEQGFNRHAPVTFLIHGFTSGYPLQSWMTAIVEAYTIEQTKRDEYKNEPRSYLTNSLFTQSETTENTSLHDQLVGHNVFIVNWFKGARATGGFFAQPSEYGRAVQNLRVVADYVTKFINHVLINEAKVDAANIEIIGHSLGAQMAGFIGKKTKRKLGKIFGLDPAGPCFGKFHDEWSYEDERLNPNDALNVITVHTNSEVFGLSAPLGQHSIFVEGGRNQPDCQKASDVVYKVLKFDTSEFNKISCSHSRAPSLLTSRLSIFGNDDCQLVAYECPYKKGWDRFKDGLCGVCNNSLDGAENLLSSRAEPELDDQEPIEIDNKSRSPLDPVHCTRMGLDWQYGGKSRSARGSILPIYGSVSSPYSEALVMDRDDDESSPIPSSSTTTTTSPDITTTTTTTTTTSKPQAKKKPMKLYMRTTNTQPYCVYHYQVVLELSQPLTEADVPMSLVLQDAKQRDETLKANVEPSKFGLMVRTRNSLTSDNIINKFNDVMYTKLIISTKKLTKVEHATLIVRKNLQDIDLTKFKTLHVNYMSSINDQDRKDLSSVLCRVTTKPKNTSKKASLVGIKKEISGHVIYFSTKCGERSGKKRSSHITSKAAS